MNENEIPTKDNLLSSFFKSAHMPLFCTWFIFSIVFISTDDSLGFDTLMFVFISAPAITFVVWAFSFLPVMISQLFIGKWTIDRPITRNFVHFGLMLLVAYLFYSDYIDIFYFSLILIGIISAILAANKK